ncbi:MAG: dTDP-4-dehydrorhamnose 3,5-epimerase [Anaerolineae bacterium]|nr:dTDP-4-dehydrorhamnose 3,5-epimerase [Anaerolineae bacterium]
MPDIRPLNLEGVYEITLNPHGDKRGYFVETYRAEFFAAHGLQTEWVQENQSLSTRKGVIRGLHFQKPPYAQAKLVRAVIGTVFDVFVDLRKDSPTYGQWGGVELTAEKFNMVYIPRGFAHGFCTLTADVMAAYKVDEYFNAESEDGLMWNDPAVGIAWPCADPLLSGRDQKWGPFEAFESPF